MKLISEKVFLERECLCLIRLIHHKKKEKMLNFIEIFNFSCLISCILSSDMMLKCTYKTLEHLPYPTTLIKIYASISLSPYKLDLHTNTNLYITISLK